jgi:hypothetical protein
MICGMGMLVIVPDGFAYPKQTAMGQTLWLLCRGHVA